MTAITGIAGCRARAVGGHPAADPAIISCRFIACSKAEDHANFGSQCA